MLQHTPLAVTVAPPSVNTVPPDMAVVLVTPDTGVVTTLGGTARVVNVRSAP